MCSAVTLSPEHYRLDAIWPAPPGVVAFTTLRASQCAQVGHSLAPFDRFNLGAACGDTSEAVQANLQQLIALAGLPNPPCWLRQTHGTTVHRFDRSTSDVPEADASVTGADNLVLAILTADCLPVLLAARDGSEVGAAHAGWRGLCSGVLESTVAAMKTSPSQLLAWLGPAAGPDHYEVGTEVHDAFLAVDPQAELAFVPTRPGHWLCNLFLLARQRLAKVGISAVFGGDHCTIQSAARWFSHRRDGRSGRMASLIYRQR